MEDVYVGVDLGGTNTKTGCFGSDLMLIGKSSLRTEVHEGVEAVVDRVAEGIKGLLAEHNLSLGMVPAVGIGSPGVIDVDNGVVMVTSNLKFENVPLRKMLSERLDKPVILENDANVTAWAERVAGAGKGADDMVLLALGTGIGGGIISNGELVHGFGNNGGELGHIIIYPDGRLCGCGQRGCVEAYASASSTAARAVEAIKEGGQSSLEKVYKETGEVSCKDVYEHSKSGDELARTITDGTGKALALLCVNLLHTCGPQRIVFFGAMTAEGERLLKPIQRFFDEYIWALRKEPIELCLAMLGNDAGITGTAALAKHKKERGRLGFVGE